MGLRPWLVAIALLAVTANVFSDELCIDGRCTAWTEGQPIAAADRDRSFVLAGAGWDDKPKPDNVAYVGHLYTEDHNAFNASALAVLNVSRDSMASYGYSPATRVFEAAGAGACIVTDSWEGIPLFFEPGREILVADSGPGVAEHVARLTPAEGERIGAAARRRALATHTYAQRVQLVEDVLAGRAP